MLIFHESLQHLRHFEYCKKDTSHLHKSLPKIPNDIVSMRWLVNISKIYAKVKTKYVGALSPRALSEM